MNVPRFADAPEQVSAIAGIFRKWFHGTSAEGGHTSAPQVCFGHPAQLLVLNAMKSPAIGRPMDKIQLHTRLQALSLPEHGFPQDFACRKISFLMCTMPSVFVKCCCASHQPEFGDVVVQTGTVQARPQLAPLHHRPFGEDLTQMTCASLTRIGPILSAVS